VATSEAGIRAWLCLISLTGAPVAVGFIAQIGDRSANSASSGTTSTLTTLASGGRSTHANIGAVAWPLTALVTCRPSNHVDSRRRGTPLTRSW
jgi:hypothetical protein